MSEIICEVCGRTCNRKLYSDNKVVCERHYRQFKKHGKFLDSTARTIYDKNEIRIDGSDAYMDLYDINCNVVATTVFDAEDVNRVKDNKWRYLNGYVRRNLPDKSFEHFHRVILGVDTFVDHIDGDTLNNRKSNLRVATKSENAMNQFGVKGVNRRDDGKYIAHIKYKQKMCIFAAQDNEQDALWIRWYAERLLFKDFAKQSDEPIIDEFKKKSLKYYVNNRIRDWTAKYNLV